MRWCTAARTVSFATSRPSTSPRCPLTASRSAVRLACAQRRNLALMVPSPPPPPRLLGSWGWHGWLWRGAGGAAVPLRAPMGDRPRHGQPTQLKQRTTGRAPSTAHRLHTETDGVNTRIYQSGGAAGSTRLHTAPHLLIPSSPHPLIPSSPHSRQALWAKTRKR